MGSAVPFLVFLLVFVVMVGAGLLFNLSLYTRGAFGTQRLAAVPATESAVDDRPYMGIDTLNRSMSTAVRRMLFAVASILVTFGLLLSVMLTGRF